jgi:hypothetical protein
MVAGAVLVLGAAPLVADGGIGVGDVAPDFEGRAFYNTEPITLASLRGHVILFELFSTG